MTIDTTVDTGTIGADEAGDDDQAPDQIADLSDEELEAAISGKSIPSDDSDANDLPQPEQGVVNDPATPPSGDTPPDPKFVKPEELPKQPTPEEYEQIKNRLEEQRKFLDRRSQEIGELRKQKSDLIAQLQAKAAELEYDNPREAARYDRAIEEARQSEQRLATQQLEAQRLHEAVTIVPKYVKPEEFSIEDMILELKEDGVTNADFIERFKENPYKTQYPETLIHLAKRAHYGKHLRTLVPLMRNMHEENQRLKEQIKNKGEQVMRGIKKAVNSAPPITTNGSATANSNKAKASEDPSLLSDAELEAYLKQAGQDNG